MPTSPNQGFHELLLVARRGEAGAAQTLHDRYAHHVRAVIRHHLKQRAPALRSLYDSDDFMQDVFKDFFAHHLASGTFDRPEDMLALLVAMAGSHFRDTVRRHRCGRRNELNKRESLDDSALHPQRALVDPAPSAADVFQASETLAHLKAGCSESQRRILELKGLGYCINSIAALLQFSERTIRRLLKKAEPPS